MKKLIPIALALSPAIMLAEGEGQSAAAQVGGSVQSAVEGAATTLTPMLVTIITAGIGLWLVVTLPGILKRAWSSGKGR